MIVTLWIRIDVPTVFRFTNENKNGLEFVDRFRSIKCSRRLFIIMGCPSMIFIINTYQKY